MVKTVYHRVSVFELEEHCRVMARVMFCLVLARAIESPLVDSTIRDWKDLIERKSWLIARRE